jgi:hypothetical protein
VVRHQYSGQLTSVDSLFQLRLEVNEHQSNIQQECRYRINLQLEDACWNAVSGTTQTGACQMLAEKARMYSRASCQLFPRISLQEITTHLGFTYKSKEIDATFESSSPAVQIRGRGSFEISSSNQ